MEDENRQKVLPKYMKALDGDNKSKEEKDELWQDLIVQSETKLIFIDCHVAWCGPCETMYEQYKRIRVETDDVDDRFVIVAACIDDFAEQMQTTIPSDSHIDVAQNGSFPLFIFLRHKVCVACIPGIDAPQFNMHFTNHLPEAK